MDKGLWSTWKEATLLHPQSIFLIYCKQQLKKLFTFQTIKNYVASLRKQLFAYQSKEKITPVVFLSSGVSSIIFLLSTLPCKHCKSNNYLPVSNLKDLLDIFSLISTPAVLIEKKKFLKLQKNLFEIYKKNEFKILIVSFSKTERLVSSYPFKERDVVQFFLDQQITSARRICDSFQKQDDEQFEYALKTSGTTSNSGLYVFVQFQSMWDNVVDFAIEWKVTKNDTILLSSPLHFDPSLIDLFLSISSGCQLLLVGNKIKRNKKQLFEIIKNEKCTILQCTPSLLLNAKHSQLVDLFNPEDTHLRIVALGGEPVPSIAHLLPRILSEKYLGNKEGSNEGHSIPWKIYQLYGITEVSVWAMMNQLFPPNSLSGEEEVFGPLGKPLSNTFIELREPLTNEKVSHRGILWIKRLPSCKIVSTDSICEAEFKSSGDLVEIKNGQYYFVKREKLDRICKVQGKKVDLFLLERKILAFTMIENIFIAQIFLQDLDLIVGLKLFVQITDFSAKDFADQLKIQEKIWSFLLQRLEAFENPIEIDIVDALPLTNNFKIDTKLLLRGNKINEIRKLPDFATKDKLFDYLADVLSFLIGGHFQLSGKKRNRGSELFSNQQYLYQLGATSLDSLRVIHFLANNIPPLADQTVKNSLLEYLQFNSLLEFGNKLYGFLSGVECKPIDNPAIVELQEPLMAGKYKKTEKESHKTNKMYIFSKNSTILLIDGHQVERVAESPFATAIPSLDLDIQWKVKLGKCV